MSGNHETMLKSELQAAKQEIEGLRLQIRVRQAKTDLALAQVAFMQNQLELAKHLLTTNSPIAQAALKAEIDLLKEHLLALQQDNELVRTQKAELENMFITELEQTKNSFAPYVEFYLKYQAGAAAPREPMLFSNVHQKQNEVDDLDFLFEELANDPMFSQTLRSP